MDDPSPIANVCERAGKIKKLAHTNPLARSIAEEVCREYDVSLSDVRGKSCLRAYTVPRQAVMWALYKSQRFSLCEIGHFLSRDHSTVVWGIRRHTERIHG